MLKLFRQKQRLVRGLLFVIVGVVGLMMVVTLVPGVGGGDVSLRDPQGLLARVGDASVTQNEVQQQYQRLSDQFGSQASLLRQLMMERLVEELITQRVVEYEAQRLGLEVTPAEVAARLRQMSLFYPGGKFVGAEAYRRLVQQQFRMTVPEFEELVRRQAVGAKLFVWMTGGLTVSPAEVEQEYRRRNERVQIELAVARSETLAAGLNPSEQELRAYFEPNRERYRIPERRAVRFVPVDYDALKARLAVTPQELEAYYHSRQESYRLPEQVRARHILFLRQPASATEPRNPTELRKRAEEVLAQVRREKDFAALTRQHSDDATSREKGGEIGWVQRGQTAPALEQALFSLPAGAAELVETSYGIHIVQVLEYQPARVKPLAEVQWEIESVLKEQKVRQRALEDAQRMVAAVRAGRSLEEAAQEVNWPVRESLLFTRDETLPQFGANRDFQEAALRLPADSAGKPNAAVSEPVAVPSGYAVLQLKEVSPAHAASFEEVRAKVEQAYRQERSGELARQAAERLAEEVQKAGQLPGPAQKLGLPVSTPEKFSRDGAGAALGPVRDIASAAFSLPVGGISPATPAGGNWVVFHVLAREEADLSKLSLAERKNVSDFLLQEKRNLAWSIFHESLKKRLLAEGKLQLNQAAINRLTGKK